jgi:hypothetical protein
MCKLSSETQRNATEIGVSQQIIQIVWEQIKDKAQMLAEHEMSPKPNYNGHENIRITVQYLEG